MDRSDAPRAERRRLTHVDRRGRPRMVDVSAKPPTARRAVAEAEVAVSSETLSLVIDGGGSKGDVLTVAELAGVMGGKRTAELMEGDVPIHSVRLPGIVADQEVILGDVAQTLRITHQTTDRTSFMPGVLLAVRKVGSLDDSLVVGLEHLL